MKLKASSLVIGLCLVLSCGLASAQSHALKETYIDAGYYGSGFSIPASEWTAVGPVVDIVCSGTTTCTIQAVHSIQFRDSSSAGNEVQINFMLDGKSLTLAQQVGEVPTDGSFVVFSATELEKAIAAGSHTVQTLVYSVDGTTVWDYSTNYQVFKP
jgi:hypothetical protein